MNIKFLFASLVFIIQSFILFSQATLRGNVYDKASGEPVAYATVKLSNGFGASTDINGFYTITNIPIGQHTAIASFIGYEENSLELNISSKEIINKAFFLVEKSVELGNIEISAAREAARATVQISTVKLTPQQIKSLPSVGGEADIAQYLPVLPGVISSGDQGGQIYIRGGSPIQNKILLDGMTIYNPFHSIGLFSVFETEAVRSIDVMTGGFGAEYGNRVSAVVDIKTREGNKKRLSGLVSANPFLAKAVVEGPIIPLKSEGGSSVSFLLTGKYAYLNESSKKIYNYLPDSVQLPYSFNDVYGKISFVSGTGSRVNAFGFNFTDRVNFVNVADFDWRNSGGGIHFSLVPPSSKLIIGGTIAYSDYTSRLREVGEDLRTSGIKGFNANLDFTYFGTNSELKYGLEVNGFRTDFQFRNLFKNTITIADNTTEIGGFVKYRHTFANLVIEPSMRLQYYASLGDFSFEPRLGAKYKVTDGLRLKVAGGLYSQNLISTVNERDVVNLFVGYLSGPEATLYKPSSKETTTSRLQKSAHAIFGVEIDVMKNLELNIEPYWKHFSQLINLNRNKRSATDPNFITETGNAYGIDFSMKYDTKPLYLWATYSLGYVTRNDGKETYPPIFDRRHNINLVTTYRFGTNHSWEASGRWNFGTGFPFTLTQGFYGNNSLENGIGTNVVTENPNLGVIYSNARNSGRLPDYHRLDVSLHKKIGFTKYLSMDIVASVTNVYNRQNIFYFDRIKYKRVNQLPLLPSLGVMVHF
jgi:hypothetical protein